MSSEEALTAIMVYNAYEADVHVWKDPDSRVMDARRDWSAIVDAEGEVVAFVEPKNADVFAKILNLVAHKAMFE
jgi:hypothetical protein